MQNDVQLQYQQSLDESHFGHPTVIETIYTGSRGRPSIQIDPDFLRWAYSLCSVRSIAGFLGISRRHVRQQLLENGIVESQSQPLNLSAGYANNETHGDYDDLLDPLDAGTPTVEAEPVTSYTAPQLQISSDDLDALLCRLRHHFRRAGVSMLMGMLRRLGYHIAREHVRQSLLRIDPASGKTQNRNLAQQNRIMQMSRNYSNYATLHMILYYLRDQEEFSITRDCIIHGLYSFYGVVHNSIEMAVSKAVDKECLASVEDITTCPFRWCHRSKLR